MVGKRIIEGAKDALDFAQGDTSRGIAHPMTTAEKMREAAAQVAENVLYAPECCRDHSIAIAAAIRALPVDVNETPLCEHQTGLTLTDAPQRPADPVMEEVGLETLRPIWKAHGGSWHGPRVEHWKIPEANMAAFFNAALALIKGRG